MRPIPKSLLPHTVGYVKKTDGGRWGEVVSDAPLELRYVRMEPSGKIIRDKNNAEIQLAATLFYDCRNSQPTDIFFEVDDLIIFNGQPHRIKTVDLLYDRSRLHHIEMGLIRYAQD